MLKNIEPQRYFMRPYERYLLKSVQEDLKSKMVMIAGPRQVGKTTFSKNLSHLKTEYLNYDIPQDRQTILKGTFQRDSSLIIFDEIHKYKNWRNYLKGFYDAQDRHLKKILVTGSAKLDLYRRGGDSLQGRYFFYRMHPLSVEELKIKTFSDLKELFHLGGFPEPFFSSSQKAAGRWRSDYTSRLIHEEVNSLEKVDDLGRLELLAYRLPELVGSPLSINSLREDLSGASHRGVSHWIEIFEKLYLIYRLPPFGHTKIKSVKKEQKHYHWDWALVEQDGPRFENFIANHLLKWVHWKKDTEGEVVELCYLRDQLGREVDFVLVEKKQPKILVECKWNDVTISPHLLYFKNKFPQARSYQVVMNPKKEFITKEGIEIISALNFLQQFC
jgi:predicted AAA+ superfamily ATPase